MSREIKFRVWDKKQKRFIFNWAILGYSHFCINSGARSILHTENKKDVLVEIYDKPEVFGHGSYGNIKTVTSYYDFPVSKEEEWEIQQFTGLKDKNGKGIYEGDILKIKVTGTILIFSTGEYMASVEYNENSMEYRLNILEKKGKKHCQFNPSFAADPGREYEVIGNIYENPELIPYLKTHKYNEFTPT